MNTRTKEARPPIRLPIMGDQKQEKYQPKLGPKPPALKGEEESPNFAKVGGLLCKTVGLPKASL